MTPAPERRRKRPFRSDGGDGGARKRPPPCSLRLGRGARVPVAVLVKVARLVSRVRVMLAWLFGNARVAMAVLVDVAGGMAGVIVVLVASVVRHAALLFAPQFWLRAPDLQPAWLRTQGV